jgi:hypothetical protein
MREQLLARLKGDFLKVITEDPVKILFGEFLEKRCSAQEFGK